MDGLVDVSRSENGSVRIQRAPVNLHDLLHQLGDMFRLQAAARGIQFSHSRAPHLPQWVYSDEKRLRQILINLISNAIKYTPHGRSEEHTSELQSLMRISYAVFCLKKKTYIYLKHSDNTNTKIKKH